MKRSPAAAFSSSCYSEVTMLAGLIRWGFVITQKSLTVMQLQTSLPRYLLCWVDVPTFCSRFTQWLSNCGLTAAYCTLKTEHTCHFELRCTETAENIRLLFTDVAGLGLGTEATGKRRHLPFINTPQLYINMEVCSEVCVPDRSFCFILCTYLLWCQSWALRRDNLKVEMTQNVTSKYLQPPEWQLPMNQHAWEAWPCPPLHQVSSVWARASMIDTQWKTTWICSIRLLTRSRATSAPTPALAPASLMSS